MHLLINYTKIFLKTTLLVFFYLAHCASTKKKNKTLIRGDTSSQMNDYIDKVISPGIVIEIPPPKYDMNSMLFFFHFEVLINMID